MKKYMLLFSLIFLQSLILQSKFTVYADKTTTEATTEQTSNSGSGKGIGQGSVTDKDLKDKYGVSDTAIERAKGWVSVFQADGWSDAAIGGTLGNAIAESTWNPLCEETGGEGGGLFQYTPVTNFSNSKENKNCKHKKGSCQGQQICSDGACQCAYEIINLDSLIQSYHGDFKKYNDYVDSGKAKNHVSSRYKDAKGSDVPKLSNADIKGIDGFRTLTSPYEASIIFHIVSERSAALNCPIFNWSLDRVVYNGVKAGDMYVEGFSKGGTRMKASNTVYEWINGSSGGSTELSDEAKQAGAEIAMTLVANGYWNEHDLEAYTKLNEINIDEEWLKDALKENLAQQELQTLSRWQENSTAIKSDSTLVKIMRVTMQVFGILITLWGLLFYIAYWLDRLNNFIDIDFVSIMSLNKLQISEDESDCNFKLTEMKGKGKRTINHAMCLGISVTVIAFGALIMTGVLFNLVSKLVIWVSHIFDKGVS